MKANPDQPAGAQSGATPSPGTRAEHPTVSTVDPPVKPRTWFKNYNEEWADFLAEKTKMKPRQDNHSCEPEPLPRVWNCPHQ
jgi:hypothetical protein